MTPQQAQLLLANVRAGAKSKAKPLEDLAKQRGVADVKRVKGNRAQLENFNQNKPKKKRKPNRKNKEKKIEPWPPFTSPQCKIGIDPAMREGGLAICIIDENNEAYFKVFAKYRDFQKWIKGDLPANALVTVENSDLQNQTFDKKGNIHQVAAKSRSVGKNQGISHAIVESCIERWGEKRVRDISPRQKGAKWNPLQFKAALQKFRIKCFNLQHQQDEYDALQIAVWEPRTYFKT